MQQPNFPPPGQQDPITIVDYRPPSPAGDKRPKNSNTRPGQNMPQQNYQNQQPQMGQPQSRSETTMQQPNFPPPGQQDPITIVDYPPPSPAGDKRPKNSNTRTGQNMRQQNYQNQQPQMGEPQSRSETTMQQPNFPPPGLQDPITIVDYPPPSPAGDKKPKNSNTQPGQNMPQQNYQYQQPQMGQPQYQYHQQQMMGQPQYQQPQMGQPVPMPVPPQQYYQQQGGQYYQRPVQQMPRQQFPVAAPPMGVQGAYPMQALPVQPWSTELFDCAQDMENTIITFFCPCITFGQIADITDRGMTTCSSAGIIYMFILSFTGLQWIYSWMYRTKLRQQYSLAEDPCHDLLIHLFCEYCALCQEYRELKNRGFNMDLGWIGNMQLQAQMGSAQRVPPPVQGMTR